MRTLTASALWFLCGACGWHAGLGTPAGARSVSVEVVRREGKVLERGLEPLLTDALSEAVVDWVDLPLLAPAQADLVVRGELLEYRRRGGVRTPDNQLIESAVLIRARAELYDRRRGKTVGAPAQAQEWSGYTLDDTASEDAARDRALRHVAVALVLQLFEPSEAAPDPAPESLALDPR
ncbi:MAG: hypothetical protein HOP15_07365 [Planctomycetes bacterium]|nr:hypothetical protein [Planctomycetota bacterium]